MSNVEIRHFSGIATEKEILFLHLSFFKITNVNEDRFLNETIKIIKFNYFGMLLK